MRKREKTISDSELKEELERITSRIDAIVRTVSRYYPDAEPSAENNAKREDAGTE